jgi:hypothetical protein
MSALQVLTPVVGAAQTLFSAAISCSTQAWPCAVLHLVSSTHATGHCVAATQAFPAEPKSQHICPVVMSQSWSEVQSLLHVAWQIPLGGAVVVVVFAPPVAPAPLVGVAPLPPLAGAPVAPAAVAPAVAAPGVAPVPVAWVEVPPPFAVVPAGPDVVVFWPTAPPVAEAPPTGFVEAVALLVEPPMSLEFDELELLLQPTPKPNNAATATPLTKNEFLMTPISAAGATSTIARACNYADEPRRA